jgi:hypothetical protein
MSHLSTTASAATRRAERAQLDRLCTSIRGKLQFMDYLVRAAAADIERFDGEQDAGTRIFLRQLIEMHTANLSVECENMGLLSELCEALESAVAPDTIPTGFRNGDAA